MSRSRGWVPIGEVVGNVIAGLPKPKWMRTCVIRGCGKPVPITPGPQYEAHLCDEHYAPVSEKVVNAWIDRVLSKPTEERR